MTSEGFSPLFSMVVPPAMTGEKMVRKESFWAEHLGEQVINPALQFVMTVCSKAACPLVLGRRGVPRQQRTLVDQGRLCGMLWSTRDAAQQVAEGRIEAAASTGSASSGGHQSPPTTGCTELFLNIDRGVSFHGPTPGAHGRRVRGEQRHGRQTANPSSGDFSVTTSSSSRSRTGKSLGRSSRRACLATSPNPSTVRFTWARMYVGKVPTPRAACTYRTCC